MQILLDESILLSSIGLTLVHFLWQGLAVAFVLKIVFWLLPKANAQLRYIAATIALFSCLLLPFITFFYIYQPENIVNQAVQLSPIATLFDLNQNQSEQALWQQSFAETLPHLTIIWLSVAALLALKMLLEMRSVNRLPYEQSVEASLNLERRFTQLCQRMGFDKLPKLRISLKTKVPMAIGFLKPVVVLPASMVTGLTPAQLDMLILHELAHIRRHDYLVNLLQSFAEIILFFHPVIYWISKQMRVEREFCSDDMAVKQCGNAIAYAHTLADTASLCHKHRNQSIPMMAMAASGGDLKERILRLVQPHHCTQSNDTSKWLASIVVIGSIVLFAASQLAKVNNLVLSSTPSILINSVAKPQSLAVFEASSALFENDTLPPLSIAKQLLGEDDYKSSPNSYSRPATLQSDQEDERPSPAIEVVEQNSKSPELKNATRIEKPHEVVAPKKEKTIVTKVPEVASKPLDIIAQSKIPESKYAKEVQSLGQPQANDIKPISKPQKTVETKQIEILPKSIAPKLVKSTEPKYPIVAKRKKLEIEMLVNFTIDKQGYVKDINFEYKPKVSYFRTAIRNALSQWRFKPAEENGKAVESKMSKIFSFSLAH
ncbi:M56 family metallopeptidase [Thalassotalea eurytherma]|uniref:TonB C-terminal domain-containing protein n=1 Tax=Thalassotalea eurytherma TaxID=1144278 RepID=A0ABQ6H5G5_9GAMM|nr:M56 family metallopeptidase [Thalassotalea eurytherma]GLX82067.1 hypothetical protein theurythT_15190 [Thalassotalea eurytherma]